MDDMEKRAMIAVALSIVVLVVYTQFFAPQPPEVPEVPAGGEVAAPLGTGSSGLPPSPEPELAAAPEAPAELPPVGAEIEETATVRTELAEVVLTNRGGRVVSWKLLQYTDDAGEAVQLVSPGARRTGQLPLSIWVPGRDELTARIDQALFVVEREPGQGSERIRMRYSEPSGLQVEKSLVFRRGSYVVQASASVTEGGRPLPAWLSWGPGFGETAEGSADEENGFLLTGQAVVARGGSVTRLGESDAETARPVEPGEPIRWAGMETTYFAALMIPEAPVAGAVLLPAEVRTPPDAEAGEEEETVRRFVGIALEPADAGGDSRYTLFVGPKDFALLREAGDGLTAVIDFGWPIIRDIAQGLYLAMVWIEGYVGNYGVAILVLTFIIRLVFFPLMYGTQVKMRQMQAKTKKIQPKMKAIKERYRKAKMDFQSRQKMNEEIMALYRKEGINPMGGLGGCLPIMLQLPFLYGFYQLLRVTIELRHAPFFGWIQDLSRPDPYYVTPLLMGASMLVQTKISMASVADPNQRRMMTMMSVVFTVFFLNLPSGLVLYWLFSNLLGIAQQVLVNRKADHDLEAEKRKKPRKQRGEARAASRG